MSVPYNELSRRAAASRDELRSVAERVLSSGRYILDKEVTAFESSFASYVGVKHCVGVNSGTDALALALRALDVGVGDEVITVANTATATVSAIRMTGATPVFADIDAAHVMDPEDIEKRITSKTKVILPVHLYGFPADMQAINAVAKKHGLRVLEDAAQAHGAAIAGVQVGNFGDITAFSFYPTKNLGAFGDGGAIVTNDAELAERVKRLRVYGEKTRYDSIEEGVNSRLDELQAAFLSWGLPQLEKRNARRREIADQYRSSMKNPAVSLPSQDNGARKGVWHLFVVEVEDRKSFLAHMKQKGIGTAIHYPLPVYRQKAYEFLKVDPEEYPVTERVCDRIVSLPLFPELTATEVDEVIAAVNSYSA